MTFPATESCGAARGHALPFSRRASAAELEECAERFVRGLGLSAGVRVFGGVGLSGLDAERRFRLAWWARGRDPLRAALQRMKVRVFREAEARGASGVLEAAWRAAEREVAGASWRERLRATTRGRAGDDAALLRLAFRTAQQAWSRDARWRAVMRASEPSPFAPMLEMFSGGAWPLGCHDGAVSVMLLDEHAGPSDERGHPGSESARGETWGAPAAEKVAPRERAAGYIFLSAKFRDSAVTRRWESALASAGWATMHGPVAEEETAPEAQLGARIRAARAVLGICDAPDPDFGLPWWMFQELDYARECGRPVFLVTRGATPDVGRAHLERLCGTPPDCDAEPELRGWLEANARVMWDEKR
jgi:hypothetical protein